MWLEAGVARVVQQFSRARVCVLNGLVERRSVLKVKGEHVFKEQLADAIEVMQCAHRECSGKRAVHVPNLRGRVDLLITRNGIRH